MTHWVAAVAGQDNGSEVCRSGIGSLLVNSAPEPKTPERTDDLPGQSSRPGTTGSGYEKNEKRFDVKGTV